MAYTTVCLSAFEHRERIALVNWVTGVQWVASRCYRMAPGVFSSLIIRQAPENADISRCLIAGEPTFTIGHIVSPNPRVRRGRGKTTFVSDLGANFGHSNYQPGRQDRYRGTAQPAKEPEIPYDTVPSPTPHCLGVRCIRKSGNEPSGNIRSSIKSVSEMSLWNRCLVYLDLKHPFLYQTQRNTQEVAYVLDATETARQSSRPRVSVY
jgi:hypothetical protein